MEGGDSTPKLVAKGQSDALYFVAQGGLDPMDDLLTDRFLGHRVDGRIGVMGQQVKRTWPKRNTC